VTEVRSSKLLRIAAVLTLVGLGLMLWSIFVPTALPVVLAMSLGQAIGILAFAMYGYVVLADVRAQRARARSALRRAAVTIHRAAELEARTSESATAAAKTAAAAAETTAAALAAASGQAPEAEAPREPSGRKEPS
jgi:hypothetical protein